MLRLAVATDAETYDRMVTPLRERGIDAAYVPTAERAIDLADGWRAYATEREAEGNQSQAGSRSVGPAGSDASPGDQQADPFDVGFVFPPRLAEGGVADALLDIPWVNDREALLRSRQKGEAIARLSRAGVPTPETVVVSNEAGTDSLIAAFERFDPPVVVKPNNTTRGTGVAKAHDIDSFLGICDYLELVHDYRATGDQSFLVQEFLPDARDYRVMVVDGEVVGAVERQLSTAALDAGQWKHNVHQGATAERVTLDDELAALATKAAVTLDIPWLGVDLLVTDDRTVVNETNARPTIDSPSKYADGFWDTVASLIRAQV